MPWRGPRARERAWHPCGMSPIAATRTATQPVATTPAAAATPRSGSGRDSTPIVGHAPVAQWTGPPPMTLKPGVSYTASLATSDGSIGVQLLPGIAPNAVNNFVALARQGFYRNVPIHRMIPGFMFQSGDPTGTGTGGPGYNIPDDPVPPGVDYRKGVVAMANTGAPNSGGSQFFVMLGDVPLPPTYSVFGVVKRGAAVLDRINARPVTDNGQGELSRPVDPIGIRNVRIRETPIKDAQSTSDARRARRGR